MPPRQAVKHYKDQKGIIEKFAAPQIPTKFPELKFVKILYTFRKPNAMDGERVILARTRRCSTRERDVYGYDFEMEVGLDTWRKMDEERKTRLTAHEMRHMGVDLDEDGVPVRDEHNRVRIFVIPHDISIEVFKDEMREHGVPSLYVTDLIFLTRQAKKRVDKKGIQD
jgi:hypothetical protein